MHISDFKINSYHLRLSNRKTPNGNPVVLILVGESLKRNTCIGYSFFHERSSGYHQKTYHSKQNESGTIDKDTLKEIIEHDLFYDLWHQDCDDREKCGLKMNDIPMGYDQIEELDDKKSRKFLYIISRINDPLFSSLWNSIWLKDYESIKIAKAMKDSIIIDPSGVQ